MTGNRTFKFDRPDVDAHYVLWSLICTLIIIFYQNGLEGYKSQKNAKITWMERSSSAAVENVSVVRKHYRYLNINEKNNVVSGRRFRERLRDRSDLDLFVGQENCCWKSVCLSLAFYKLRGTIDVKLLLELEIEGQRRNGTREYVGIVVICGETLHAGAFSFKFAGIFVVNLLLTAMYVYPLLT